MSAERPCVSAARIVRAHPRQGARSNATGRQLAVPHRTRWDPDRAAPKPTVNVRSATLAGLDPEDSHDPGLATQGRLHALHRFVFFLSWRARASQRTIISICHINSKVNSTTTHRSHGLVQILALRVGLVFGLKISSEYCSSRPATVTAKCRSPELCVSSKIDVPGGSGSWAFQLLGFM